MTSNPANYRAEIYARYYAKNKDLINLRVKLRYWEKRVLFLENKILEATKKELIPNKITAQAMKAARDGKLTKVKSLNKLIGALNKNKHRGIKHGK